MTEQHVPVLIVGGGPVGLALAADLGWRGVPCLLVEQTDGAIHTPKMNEVNVRTMEFCRRWGIADRVHGCPFPADHSMDIVFVTSMGGHELGRMHRPSKGAQKAGPHSPVNLTICSQKWFDPMLMDLARSFSCVEIRHRCRMESFEERADGVIATLVDVDTGESRAVRADFLAACDGANSPIRRRAGIGLSGNDVLSRPAHLFFRTPDLCKQMGLKQGTFFLAVDREGMWANIRVIDPDDGVWRLMALDSPEGLTPDKIDRDALLRRALGRDLKVEWLGASIWTRRGVVADAYRSKSVFILGDAAHQLSPTGALGMNTGIGDSVDLAWKIAGVHAGWGGSGLLDSYDAERRPIGARNVAMATKFFEMHLEFDSGIAAIEDDTPEGARVRADVGPRMTHEVSKMFRTLGLQLGYRYDNSPICVADGSPSEPDDPENYTPSTRPGARAPHAWLADGRSTLDLFGKGFTLLCLGDEAPDPSPLVEAARGAGVPMSVETIDIPEISALYAAPLVLVRPDGHVAWRGAATPADPAAILDKARGAGSP